MSGNKLFIINVILIAGLIGAGFLLQQRNSNLAPTVSTSPSRQAVSAASGSPAEVSLGVASDNAVRQSDITIPSSTPAISAKKKIPRTPSIRWRSRDSENE